MRLPWNQLDRRDFGSSRAPLSLAQRRSTDGTGSFNGVLELRDRDDDNRDKDDDKCDGLFGALRQILPSGRKKCQENREGGNGQPSPRPPGKPEQPKPPRPPPGPPPGVPATPPPFQGQPPPAPPPQPPQETPSQPPSPPPSEPVSTPPSEPPSTPPSQPPSQPPPETPSEAPAQPEEAQPVQNPPAASPPSETQERGPPPSETSTPPPPVDIKPQLKQPTLAPQPLTQEPSQRPVPQPAPDFEPESDSQPTATLTVTTPETTYTTRITNVPSGPASVPTIDPSALPSTTGGQVTFLPGQIAGIAIGSIAALLLVIAGIVFLWMRRSNQRRNLNSSDGPKGAQLDDNRMEAALLDAKAPVVDATAGTGTPANPPAYSSIEKSQLAVSRWLSQVRRSAVSSMGPESEAGGPGQAADVSDISSEWTGAITENTATSFKPTTALRYPKTPSIVSPLTPRHGHFHSSSLGSNTTLPVSNDGENEVTVPPAARISGVEVFVVPPSPVSSLSSFGRESYVGRTPVQRRSM